MIDVKLYHTAEGKIPFEIWLDNLKSVTAKVQVFKAVTKMETGLLADCKPVGDGVQELRLHFEKGYRLYFAYDGDKFVVLLMGSTKSDQQTAIKKAISYWQDYKERKKLTAAQQGKGEKDETRKGFNRSKTTGR